MRTLVDRKNRILREMDKLGMGKREETGISACTRKTKRICGMMI